MHDVKPLILFFGFALLGACSVEPPEDSDAARPPVVGGDGVSLTDTGDTRRIDVDATQTPVVEDCAVGQIVARVEDGWTCVSPATLTRSLVRLDNSDSSNCVGGSVISVGLDSDLNGLLDDNEIQDSQSWCPPGSSDVAAELSVNAQFNSSIEANVLSQAEISFVDVAKNNGVPPGTILAFGGPTTEIPEGWLLCDGRGLDSNAFPALHDAIGARWGTGASNCDGVCDFNLPDLRGAFLRGADTRIAAESPDPDAPRDVGTAQDDALERHGHSFWVAREQALPNGSFPTGSATAVQPGGLGFSAITSQAGGDETRPFNMAVNYIIKR